MLQKVPQSASIALLGAVQETHEAARTAAASAGGNTVTNCTHHTGMVDAAKGVVYILSRATIEQLAEIDRSTFESKGPVG